MPKKNKVNPTSNISFDAKGKYINEFVDNPKALDSEGKAEAERSSKIDEKIKNKQTVFEIGVKPAQKKRKVVCSRCQRDQQLFPSQIKACMNDEGIYVCNTCNSKR